MGTLVNGVPLQHVLGSVHRHRRLTCPSVPAATCRFAPTAHLPTSACFRARAPGPVSGQSYKAPGGGAGHAALLSRCLSAAGVCFLGILSRPRVPPRLRSAYHAPTRRRGPGRGFNVPHVETRLAQVPSCPGERRCPERRGFSRPPACRIATASPCHPGPRPAPGCIRDEASARVHCHSPHTSLPLTCDPGRNGVLGLFPELRTPPGKTRQRTSGRGPAQTLPGLRPWHQPASFDVLTHNVRPHVARSAGSGALISEGGPGPPSVTALRLRYRQPRLGLCGKRQERPALVSVAEVRPRRRAAAFPERGARCWQQRDAGRHGQPDNPAGGGATT